jgi:hypothetical protein
VTLNPFKVGAVCVFLGALLWLAPSCWFERAAPSQPEPEAPRPAQAAHPERGAVCAQCG